MYKKPNRESQNCAKASNVRKTILRNPEKPLLYNETNKIPASNLQDKLKTKTQPVEPNSNRFHDPKFNKIKELESKLNDCKLNDPLFAQTKLTIEQSRTVANREV